MEENKNTDNVQLSPEQQPATEKKSGLMPGQDREDELDIIGGALFKMIQNGFMKVKSLFTSRNPS